MKVGVPSSDPERDATHFLPVANLLHSSPYLIVRGIVANRNRGLARAC